MFLLVSCKSRMATSITPMSAKIFPIAMFLMTLAMKVSGLNMRRFVKGICTNNGLRKISTRQDVSKESTQLESLAFYDSLRACNDAYISTHINTALDVLTDACRLYGVDNLLSSYNGGKDADVIMHLLRAVVAKLEHDTGMSYKPKLVYFAVKDEFPEVIEHIQFAQRKYDLDIVQYDGGIVEVSDTATALLCASYFLHCICIHSVHRVLSNT